MHTLMLVYYIIDCAPIGNYLNAVYSLVVKDMQTHTYVYPPPTSKQSFMHSIARLQSVSALDPT